MKDFNIESRIAVFSIRPSVRIRRWWSSRSGWFRFYSRVCCGQSLLWPLYLREMQVLYLEVLLPNPKVNFFSNCSAGICLTWNDFNCFSLLQFALSLSQSSVSHLTQAVFVIAACTQPVTIQCHPYWAFQFHYSVPSKLKLYLSLQLVLSLSQSSAIHTEPFSFTIQCHPNSSCTCHCS